MPVLRLERAGRPVRPAEERMGAHRAGRRHARGRVPRSATPRPCSTTDKPEPCVRIETTPNPEHATHFGVRSTARRRSPDVMATAAGTWSYRVQDIDHHGFPRRGLPARPRIRQMVPDGYLRIETASNAGGGKPMHLTDLRIDEIVKVQGLPLYARRRATFTNGRSYDSDANFAHGHEDACIFVWRPTDGRAMDSTTRAPRGPFATGSASPRSRGASATRSRPSSTSASPPGPRAHAPRRILTFALPGGGACAPASNAIPPYTLRHQRGRSP